MNDDLRKLAEAAIEEAEAYRRGEGSDPDATARFHAAASPEVMLGLLYEVSDLKEGRFHLMAEVDKWKQEAEQSMLDYQEMYRECLDAREAVRRLAGALELLESNVFEDGAPDEALEIAQAALADPVVKRIVEGG